MIQSPLAAAAAKLAQRTGAGQSVGQAAASPTAQKAWRLSKWWARVRDVPEVLPLYGLLAFVGTCAAYTCKKVYFNNQAGSFTSIALRGDPEKQVDTAGPHGLEDPSTGKRSFWYNVAQFKVDKDGANIGIFDNRTRPHQYSKPGASGVGAGNPA